MAMTGPLFSSFSADHVYRPTPLPPLPLPPRQRPAQRAAAKAREHPPLFTTSAARPSTTSHTIEVKPLRMTDLLSSRGSLASRSASLGQRAATAMPVGVRSGGFSLISGAAP